MQYVCHWEFFISLYIFPNDCPADEHFDIQDESSFGKRDVISSQSPFFYISSAKRMQGVGCGHVFPLLQAWRSLSFIKKKTKQSFVCSCVSKPLMRITTLK